MRRYTFLAHTADAKFRAYGKNREEQFANAARAMYSLITDCSRVDEKQTQEIRVHGNDELALLVAWLSELLYYLDAKDFVMRDVKSMKIKKKNDSYEIYAMLSGDLGREKYSARSDVKAVTYAEMEITDKYVQVVVDV